MASGGTEFPVALEKLGGFGKFHYRMLLLMLPSSSSGVLVVNTVTYILPPIVCEFGLPEYARGLVFSAVYIGMLFGGFIWGAMSDLIGRRSTLLILLITVFAFESLAAVSAFYWQLFLAKVSSGFMGAGIMTTSYTYVSEFTEKRYKDKMTMSVGMMTAIGYFLQPAIAIFTIPITTEWVIIPGLIILDGWRIFQAICSLFPLVGFFVFLFIFDESPAYLLQSQQPAKALNVLKRTYAINTGKPPETYEVKDLRLDDEPTEQPGQSGQSSFVHQMRLLFYGKYTTTLIVVILLQFITMGVFGAIRSFITIILTVSLGIGQKEGGSNETTFCGLYETQALNAQKPCKENKVEVTEEVYIYTTIIGLCIFLSFVPVGALVRKIGKELSFLILHGVAAASIIFMPFPPALGVGLLLTIYAVSMQNCITITVGFILNRIPTSIRGLAVAVILIGGRLGVILGSLLYPAVKSITNCSVGFWTIAALNLAAFPLMWIYSILRNPMLHSEPDDQKRKNDG